MKHIYTFLCFFLITGVVQADKWLCGTPKSHTNFFICGTYPNAHPDDWFRQYMYILDEAPKNGDGSGRVMLREVGGKVAFNSDVCSDSTDAELSCHVNSHRFSFDRTNYSFDYWHDREAKRAENQLKSNVVDRGLELLDMLKEDLDHLAAEDLHKLQRTVDMIRRIPPFAKRNFHVSVICTPFVSHETHSNLDFNYEPELSATEHLEVLAKVVTWLDVSSFSRGRDL